MFGIYSLSPCVLPKPQNINSQKQISKLHAVSKALGKITQNTSAYEIKSKFKINDALIPPKSLVIAVPGMWSSKSTITPFARYLKQEGHDVYVFAIPHVKWAQRMNQGSKWLSNKIDDVRIVETQQKLFFIQSQLSKLEKNDQKIIWIKKHFNLDNSKVANKLAEQIFDLLINQKFIDEVHALRSNNDSYSKSTDENLSSVLMSYKKTFASNIKQDFNSDLLSKKVTNQIFDVMAPRVVLVGHSLGGAVGLQCLQRASEPKNNYKDEISMIIGLGSPFCGAPVPSRYKLLSPILYSLFYTIHQLNPFSKTITTMQKTDLPVDTTVLSLANPKDGLVSVENSKLNCDGNLQIQLTPKEADMTSLMHDNEYQSGIVNWLQSVRMSNYNKLSEMGWEALKGVRYHCGFLDPQHFDSYYSEQGEINDQVFKSSNSIQHLKKLLNPNNNETLQKQILMKMIDAMGDKDVQADEYIYLVPELEDLASTNLPCNNSSNKLSQIILNELNRK